MYPELEVGCGRFSTWKKLPDIAGTYDCFNLDPKDPDYAAIRNAYPELDNSVLGAIEESKLAVDDVLEVTYQAFGPGSEKMQESVQFFKNSSDQILLLRFVNNLNAQEYYEEAGYSYSSDLHSKLRPKFSFFGSVAEAIEGTRVLCFEISELPSDYFT